MSKSGYLQKREFHKMEEHKLR